MESNPPTIAKRMWQIVRIMYFMFRKGVSKRKLMMDLHLLLKRSKIASKAIRNLMFHHGNHHHESSAAYSGFSCRSMDPNMSFYSPREVEFSCSNTPSYPYFPSGKRKHRHHRYHYNYDASAIQKAFELLNSSEISDFTDVSTAASPIPVWAFGKSPIVRQLRITDSPFPIREEEGDVDGAVDREAEEFIGRFYEQLRLQQQMTALEAKYRQEVLGQRVYG